MTTNAATPVTPIQPYQQRFPMVDPMTGQASDYTMRFLLNHGGQITSNTDDIVTLTKEVNILDAAVINGAAGEILVSTPATIKDSPTISLAPSGVTAGSYTTANITVDAFGRVTVASNGSGSSGTLEVDLNGTNIQSAVTKMNFQGSGWSVTSPSTHNINVSFTPDLSSVVPKITQVNTGTGLSGGGDLSVNRTISLANTAVTAGTYTNPTITVDAQGRITAATSVVDDDPIYAPVVTGEMPGPVLVCDSVGAVVLVRVM